MLDFRQETKAIIEGALHGDIAVASLKIQGSSPHDLAAFISPGRPPRRLSEVEYGEAPFTRETLVELVVRMQRYRWSRFDDFTFELTPHGDDAWKQVASRIGPYPEHGDGWLDLVSAAVDMIVEAGGDPATSQLKSKFGSMRWYTKGLEGEAGGAIVDAAEHLSFRLCETCGAPGKRRSDRGWISVACEEHAHG